MLAFQEKLSEIKIFDPACGSGNFLTESFISLRRIENEILKLLFGSQIQLGELSNPIKVSISQFYGVEINDFAVSVAQTALWIAELQMIQETQEIIHRELDFLPLKSYSNIVEGNSLQLDWQKVCPNPDFIIGNPPFVGFTYQSSTARAAFVSTNSIVQGETVTRLWKNIFDAQNHIDFAYRTFIWDSESTQKAHVHCVIVGFSSAHNIFVKSRPNPLQDFVPSIGIGNKPIDDGNYLLSAKYHRMNNSCTELWSCTGGFVLPNWLWRSIIWGNKIELIAA